MNENAAVVDVTGLMENPQAFKKLLIDQIRARGGTAAVDSKSIVQGLMKQTLEAFLELEMEEHLGYPPHAAEGRGSGNSRKRHDGQDRAGRLRRGGDRNAARP
jgi:transposase-like protein